MNPGQTTQDNNRPTVTSGQVDAFVENGQFGPNGSPDFSDPTSTNLSPVDEKMLSRVGATAVVKSQDRLNNAIVEPNNAVTDEGEKQNTIQLPAHETTPKPSELTQPQEDSALAASEIGIVYTGNKLSEEAVQKVENIIDGLKGDGNTAEEYTKFTANRDMFSEAVRKGQHD